MKKSYHYYKGHSIRRTAWVHSPTGKALFEIEGKFAKKGMVRPFLCSIADSKRWITEQIVGTFCATDEDSTTKGGTA